MSFFHFNYSEAPKDVDPPSSATPAERPGREAPRPLPRPGLAGAESRGLDLPEKPELGGSRPASFRGASTEPNRAAHAPPAQHARPIGSTP